MATSRFSRYLDNLVPERDYHLTQNKCVVDRRCWHLLENATTAFVEVIKQQMRHLRRAIASGDIDPDALTAAENCNKVGRQRRDEVNGKIQGLLGQEAQPQEYPYFDHSFCESLRVYEGRFDVELVAAVMDRRTEWATAFSRSGIF